MTREELLDCLTDRPCDVCKFHTGNGCTKWKCVFEEPVDENKGEWIEWKGRYNGIPVCSNCNTGFPIVAKNYNFCPNCGADMRGE